MEYRVTTLMPSLGGASAGCSTYCDTREGALKEVRSSLAHLQPGERITVEREIDIDGLLPGAGVA